MLGLLYSAQTWRRMEDRLWHGFAPALAHLDLTVAGAAFALASEAAAAILACGVCLPLLAEIRNAWDMTTWAVLRRRG